MGIKASGEDGGDCIAVIWVGPDQIRQEGSVELVGVGEAEGGLEGKSRYRVIQLAEGSIRQDLEGGAKSRG